MGVQTRLRQMIADMLACSWDADKAVLDIHKHQAEEDALYLSKAAVNRLISEIGATMGSGKCKFTAGARKALHVMVEEQVVMWLVGKLRLMNPTPNPQTWHTMPTGFN